MPRGFSGNLIFAIIIARMLCGNHLKHDVTRSISTPPWIECQSIAELPLVSISPVPIYTPGWRDALWELCVLAKNATQCSQPGLAPRPLDPETNALTTRLSFLRMLYKTRQAHKNNCFSRRRRSTLLVPL